ncbi:MAG: adenylate/guanylate cyclase domain-containing protein [Betaproteobacteria bacterium]|nr:adenylate/guanylate cyclase domain-containing protein [Betaproteobacteria bacterium]
MVRQDRVEPGPRTETARPGIPTPDGGKELKLTVDNIPHPAYMVNYNFELTWLNDEARNRLLGGIQALPSNTEARNVFQLLMRQKPGPECAGLLRFHLALAKQRLPKSGLVSLCKDLPLDRLRLLESLYGEAETAPAGPIIECPVRVAGPDGRSQPHYAYASLFREGILFVYVPADAAADSLLSLLSRRDEVIRHLIRKRLPVLTDLAVLVADLQDSVKICSELPPEEYFELINQIWSAMEPVFRRYYGTHGKHVGDGMVYYFFPQPDCDYTMNALTCAHEIKQAMKAISKEWQLRKGWTTELYLNTGLNEGQEWLGTFQSPTHVEITVLGDTINHAARLSDFARYGAVWATKNLLGKLTSEQRQRVKYGVRRVGEEGREIFVATTYARVSSLIDLHSGHNDKLRDIAALPITEIVEVADADGK